MTDKTEAPKKLWLQIDGEDNDGEFGCEGITWCEDKINDTDIQYIRADRYAALLEAAVSLHHCLFEIVLNADADTPDMFMDAQLAIAKYNRFLDGE